MSTTYENPEQEVDQLSLDIARLKEELGRKTDSRTSAMMRASDPKIKTRREFDALPVRDQIPFFKNGGRIL